LAGFGVASSVVTDTPAGMVSGPSVKTTAVPAYPTAFTVAPLDAAAKAADRVWYRQIDGSRAPLRTSPGLVPAPGSAWRTTGDWAGDGQVQAAGVPGLHESWERAQSSTSTQTLQSEPASTGTHSSRLAPLQEVAPAVVQAPLVGHEQVAVGAPPQVWPSAQGDEEASYRQPVAASVAQATSSPPEAQNESTPVVHPPEAQSQLAVTALQAWCTEQVESEKAAQTPWASGTQVRSVWPEHSCC
jgi:hypothetical protein